MEKTGDVELTRAQKTWLRHLRKAAQGGETVRGYAARHGLSEHAMYQAAKVLRTKGVFGVAARPEKRPEPAGGAAKPHFVELKFAEPARGASAGAWRARLPNGVVIEGEGPLSGALEALGRL